MYVDVCGCMWMYVETKCQFYCIEMEMMCYLSLRGNVTFLIDTGNLMTHRF